MSKLPFNGNNKILLEQYINKLIAEGKIYKFYKSDEWLQLRKKVLEDNHNECEMCRAKGVVTKATLVHHVNYVKTYPRFALSYYVVDKQGQRKKNLLALCDKHHEQVHCRFTQGRNNINNKGKLFNEEKW